MAQFKLKAMEELFPEKAKELKADKELEYGNMFRLSAEEQRACVDTIVGLADEMIRQRQGWMSIKAEAVKNYEGIEDNRGPWAGSSNISTMVTTIAADMMHAKLFPMVWNPETLHFSSTERLDEEIAKNNEILMKWGLTKDMENTQDKVDIGIHRLVVDGVLAIKVVWEVYYTYVTRVVPKEVSGKGEIKMEVKYDQIRRERPRWLIRDIDNVLFTFNAENEQRANIIDIVWYTLPQLREMQAKGMMSPDVDLETLEAKVERTFDPEGTVKERYAAAGIESYYAVRDCIPIKTYEAYIKYSFKDSPFRKECVFWVLPDHKVYLSGKPLHTVCRIGKKPWIIRSFIPRAGTMLGKGIPELVRHLHREMNAIHNQRLDAGNMVIAPFFFYRAASGFEPKNISVKPATGIPLDDPQRDVFFPEYNPSRLSVSFQEENLIMDLVEKLTFLTPAALGRETSSRPTARGTLAVIAQGEQKFNLLGARVQRVFSDLITITRQFYEERMPPGVQERILGKNNSPVWGQLSPEMIAGQFDASMDLDLTSGDIAFEKQADQIIYQTMVQDPFVNQNPAFAWELRANYLLSLGKKDYEKLIGPKPNYEANPGDIQDENMMMVQEMPQEVGEGDDDVQHMNGHQEFKRTNFSSLSPIALRRLTEHVLAHRDAHSQKLQQQALMQQGGQNAGGETNQTGLANPVGQQRMGVIQGPRIGNSPQAAPEQAGGIGSQGGYQ